jgi:glucose-fructose oxidoreductase
MKRPSSSSRNGKRCIRYAVVGLGHIAQAAVLPAFANARKNSELTALISDDSAKLKQLSRHYKVPITGTYKDYEACLHSGEVDAVYISLPNDMHCEYTIRAAKAGCHVLCEKPLALDEDECHEMIKACADSNVKLMTAYRLHFERGNLEAAKCVQSGKIGTPRIFNSLFSMQVKEENYRVKRKHGGGPLYDLGIYCINAARYLFGSEPTEVFAYEAARKADARFRQVEEMVSAVLRFPEERLASFTASFGAADSAEFSVAGTKGLLKGIEAYGYADSMTLEITVKGKTQRREYPRRDQFGPELLYFSDCIIRDRPPEPSGTEGLLDVHIIRSIHESARLGRPVQLKQLARDRRPTLRQEIYRPAVKQRPQVKVAAAHRD